MFQGSVNTIEDVKRFFSFLVNEEKINFHPDNDFNDYVDVITGKRTLSVETVNCYNNLMNRAFNICRDSGQDIYEIGLSVLKA